jgi:hypothetical protein
MPKGSELVCLRGLKKYAENDDGTSILVGPPGLKEQAPYDDGKVWLPSGLINYFRELPNDTVELEIPFWLAQKKELEDYVE